MVSVTVAAAAKIYSYFNPDNNMDGTGG